MAGQALAHCLRTQGMAPHLEGLSVAASEKLGRRLAYNRVEFDPGLLATANVSDYFNADGYAYDDHSVDDLSGMRLCVCVVLT